MNDLDSNIDELETWFTVLFESFDFTVPGKEQSLGRDLVVVAVSGMSGRSLSEKISPSGDVWPPNSDNPSHWYPRGYKGYKEDKYEVFDQPNVRTGQMLSEESLLGQTTISSDEIEMKYGKGVPPTESKSPNNYITEQDQEITDIEKAYFCSATREFYGLNEDDCDKMMDEVLDSFDKHVRSNL